MYLNAKYIRKCYAINTIFLLLFIYNIEGNIFAFCTRKEDMDIFWTEMDEYRKNLQINTNNHKLWLYLQPPTVNIRRMPYDTHFQNMSMLIGVIYSPSIQSEM